MTNPDATTTLEDLIGFLDEHFPADWSIILDLARGIADVRLYGPPPDRREAPEIPAGDLMAMVLAAVNHARKADGLGAVGLDGHEYEEE